MATTYHLVRTLAYEGYVIRREDGTYIVGLEVADRYRELVTAFRGPPAVGETLRRAALDTGYSHYLGRFVGGQVALTAVAEGHRSPYLEDLVPGFDEGAHATALGKALLATLTTGPALPLPARVRHAAVHHRHADHHRAFEADLAAGDRRGMQMEMGQFRQGVACAAVLVAPDKDMERRVVLACALPASRDDDLRPGGTGQAAHRGPRRRRRHRRRQLTAPRGPLPGWERASRGGPAPDRRSDVSGRQPAAYARQLPTGPPSRRQVTTTPGLA